MPRKILIGIQARSGSTRLPRKAFELIGEKMMLDHVIEACKRAASYIVKKERVSARVAVLTPDGDPIATAFANRCDIVQGPEKDVLARYILALDEYEPDLVVRVTGDCPMLPSRVISRMMGLALQFGYDYVSNVDERFRTAIDGEDCEVISARLLREAGKLAVSSSDREHVTPLIRRMPPNWAEIGTAVNFFDHSGIKLSVDTLEDLERVRKAYDEAQRKYTLATRTFGQSRVHGL